MANNSEQKSKRAREQDGGAGPASRPNAIEWVVGALCALLVVAMIGFVLYQGVVEATPRPAITVERGDVGPAGDGFRVGFRALNSGGQTAAGVTVEGVLLRDGRQIEASEVQLDYVPARSERRGALLFTVDPRTHQLELRAKGYRQP